MKIKYRDEETLKWEYKEKDIEAVFHSDEFKNKWQLSLYWL